MKIIFAGTPDFAAYALDKIVSAGFEVALVLTQPDRPQGRGLKLQPSAVKKKAESLGIAVAQPESLKDEEAISLLNTVNADIMIVAAYGLILPQIILDRFKWGCLNIHASLLPRWRGAAPIQRAIEAGDQETGISIMQMAAGLDTGDVLHTVKTPVELYDTASTLHDRLMVLGAEAIVYALHHLDRLKPQVQDEQKVTYAHKLNREEAKINWQNDAVSIGRKIRAFNPVPVAWTTLNGQNLKVWQGSLGKDTGKAGKVLSVTDEGVVVGSGVGSIVLKEVQIAGGRRLPISTFLQGHPMIEGQQLGEIL